MSKNIIRYLGWSWAIVGILFGEFFLGYIIYGILAYILRISSNLSLALASLFVIITGALLLKYLYPVMQKAIVSVRMEGTAVYVKRRAGLVERLDGITRIVAISISGDESVRDLLQIYHAGGRIDADFFLFDSYPDIKRYSTISKPPLEGE